MQFFSNANALLSETIDGSCKERSTCDHCVDPFENRISPCAWSYDHSPSCISSTDVHTNWWGLLKGKRPRRRELLREWVRHSPVMGVCAELVPASNSGVSFRKFHSAFSYLFRCSSCRTALFRGKVITLLPPNAQVQADDRDPTATLSSIKDEGNKYTNAYRLALGMVSPSLLENPALFDWSWRPLTPTCAEIGGKKAMECVRTYRLVPFEGSWRQK